MATKRLIDANAVIKDIDNYYNNSPFSHPGTTWLRGLELAVGLLLKAPTVDAVEVADVKEFAEDVVYQFGYYCQKNGKDTLSLTVNGVIAEDSILRSTNPASVIVEKGEYMTAFECFIFSILSAIFWWSIYFALWGGKR